MNTNLNMQTMPIDRLKPATYNPRKDLKPGDPAYEKIKRSLHDFGYVDPIRLRYPWTFDYLTEVQNAPKTKKTLPLSRMSGLLRTGSGVL